MKKEEKPWVLAAFHLSENLSQNVTRMENMQKYNALETPTSVGAQIKEDTRFMVHIAGVLRNAHPEVSGKVMGGFLSHICLDSQ